MIRISTLNAEKMARPPCRGRDGLAGFTLVEMVGMMAIMAILAFVAAPRFFDRDFVDVDVLHDQVIVMLRHAQRIAIAQNRNVYVRLNGKSLAFCFKSFAGAAKTCDSEVLDPAGSNSGGEGCADGSSTWFCKTIRVGIIPANMPDFYFNALGQPFYAVDPPPDTPFADQLVIPLTSSAGVRQIHIERETGYVHP